MLARPVRSSSLAAAALVLAAGPASAASWVAQAELQPSSGYTVTITIDDVAETVEFALTGPDAQWFALGLGGTMMNGTYAIVTTPTPAVEERTLGNHNEGSVLTPSVTLSNHVDHLDGTVTFTLDRDVDPGNGGYAFDLNDVQQGLPIPVIFRLPSCRQPGVRPRRGVPQRSHRHDAGDG